MDVTNENFNDLYPEILKALDTANFIGKFFSYFSANYNFIDQLNFEALDAEFTGLFLNEKPR
jgi:hypothetical protein